MYAQDAEIKVDPGVKLIQDIPIGKKITLKELIGTDLVITNKSPSAKTAKFSVHTHSEVYGESVVTKEGKPVKIDRPARQGYSDIPDTKWITFDPPEVKLPSNSNTSVACSFNIPNEKRYANQHWVVVVVVHVVSPEERGMVFAFDINCFYMLETLPANVDGKESVHGKVGASPSVLGFSDVPAGVEKEIRFRIFNNDDKPHDYNLRSLSPPDQLEPDFIRRTPGFSRLPDPWWVILPDKSGEIAARSSKVVTGKVKIPGDFLDRNKKLESLILVHSPDGGTTFVRVQYGQPPRVEPLPASSADPSGGDSLTPWIIGLAALVMIGIIVLLRSRRKSADAKN